MLELRNVTKTVGGAEHIRDVSLTLQHGSLNVLLGPTLSGKTSLMRLMAGLDVPTSGSVWFDGKDVTGVPVQKRNDRHGLPAVHQLPGDDRLREHRLAAARGRRRRRPRSTSEVRKRGRAAEADALSRPHAAQPVRRPAAAHGAGPRHRQECQPGAARRAARQSRLQAARGTARRTAEDLRRGRHDLRLRHDRAARGAAARRQHGDAVAKAASPSSARPSTSSASRSIWSRRRTFADPPLNTIVLDKKGARLPARWRRRTCRCRPSSPALPTRSYTIGFQPHHLSLERPRRGRACRCRPRSRSPRSPARRASSISTSPMRAG